MTRGIAAIVRAWPYVLGAILGFVVLILSIIADAWGHDGLDWVAQQRLRNAAGEWCCGQGDCELIRAEEVRAVDGGYWLITFKEFVPQHEALPFSPQDVIRCHRPDGSLRCLIVPPQGF